MTSSVKSNEVKTYQDAVCCAQRIITGGVFFTLRDLVACLVQAFAVSCAEDAGEIVENSIVIIGYRTKYAPCSVDVYCICWVDHKSRLLMKSFLNVSRVG